MATGVGGPIGAAMIGGALLSAGASAGIQKVTTGSVNYKEVAVAGLSAASPAARAPTAPARSSAAMSRGDARRRQPAASRTSPAAAPTAASTADNPFDPAGMAQRPAARRRHRRRRLATRRRTGRR